MKFQQQVGMTLFEVVLAGFLISVFMLGIVAIQLQSLHSIRAEFYKMIANIQVQNMLERLRVNKITSYRFRELAIWNVVNHQLLPDSRGKFQCEFNQCRVTLQWKQRTLNQIQASQLF